MDIIEEKKKYQMKNLLLVHLRNIFMTTICVLLLISLMVISLPSSSKGITNIFICVIK